MGRGWVTRYPVESCENSGKSRAKDRCWRCATCDPLLKIAAERYINLSLSHEWAQDQERAQAKRRLLLATIWGKRGVSFDDFREGVTRSFLPWLKDRIAVRRYFGCIVTGDEHGAPHAHAAIDTDEQLRDAAERWMNDHPPSARTWANTTRRGLSIELMRFANEIRIRPGGKLVSFDDLEDGPVRTLLCRNSISHPRYLAQQISAADVPVGRTCYFESKNFDSHTPQGFAHFRDELIDGMRTWTFLPMYLADEADAREKVSAIAGRRRVVPSYTEEDRQRFKGSLAAMRRVLNAH